MSKVCIGDFEGLHGDDLLRKDCPDACQGQERVGMGKHLLLRASVGQASVKRLLSCFLGPQEDG